MTAAAELPLETDDDDDGLDAGADRDDETPADLAPDPAPPEPNRKKPPVKRKKRPTGGLAGQRPLQRPPITVGRHLSDGKTYGWVKTYPDVIPDENRLFADLGPGRYRLRCPAKGLQYVEIHPQAAGKQAAPQRPVGPPPEPAAFDGPQGRAPVVLLARILSVATSVLDQVRANGQAIEALARRPTGRTAPFAHVQQPPPPQPYAQQGYQPPYAPQGPPPPVWNPYTNQWSHYVDNEPEPETDSTLDRLKELAEIKYYVDEVAGMFGAVGGGGDDDEDAGWMEQGAKMLFERMAGRGAPQPAPPYAYQPGPPPQAMPPPGWSPPPQAGPPAPAPQQPAPQQAAAPAPGPPPVTLPGMTEEIANELRAMAPALGMDWASMMAMATQFGWTAQQALEAARQRVAGG